MQINLSRKDMFCPLRAQAVRILKDESGNILVLSALCLTMLLSLTALAVDVGLLFVKQSHLQSLADAAAMAGALEASTCGTTANCSVVQTAATSALTEGGSSSPTLFLQCATASGTGILLTINNGPCALGASDPNNLNANYVEAVVTQQVPTLYAGFFGIRSVRLSARAEAGKSSPAAPCLDVTGTSGQTLTLNSGATIQDGVGSTCGVNVNSSGAPAVMENSGVTVNVGTYTVHGTVTDNGGSYTPTPTTGAPTMPDPFQAEITAGTLSIPTQPAVSSPCCNPVGGTTTLQPGYYSSGLNFNGSGYTVTLSPGIYYFGGGVNVGGVTINGTGVTIYMASGQFNMNSASTINLTAPSTGPTAGLVIWQPASNTSQMNLDSGSSSNWKGGVYLPGAQLTLNGSSNAAGYGMIVANSVMMNSSITLNCSLMPGGVCPGGGSGAGNGSATIALAE
jgi:Flp pilus assembly protein TadG